MTDHFAITIGRQLGSGGRMIGEQLAQRLQIAFYDRNLIAIAAERSGMCTSVFERADEQTAQPASGILGVRFPFISGGAVASNSFLTNDALFQTQSDVIHDLANEHSCVFVGRCADYILRDHPRCINVFISASEACRIERLCNMQEMTVSAARDLIRKTDRSRAEYYNYYTLQTWGAAATYHLCINSDVLGIDGSVDLIETFVRRKLG